MMNNEQNTKPEGKQSQKRVLATLMRIDNLGRVVIPIAIFRRMNLNAEDSVNITMYQDTLIVRKHIPNVSRHNNYIGLIRKLDSLHRFVLPKELRDELDMDMLQPVLVRMCDDVIIIEKWDEEA